MVDRDVLAAKLGDLADRCARVRARAPATEEALRTDRDALDLVAFNLMLAVQICADIASHVISDGGMIGACAHRGIRGSHAISRHLRSIRQRQVNAEGESAGFPLVGSFWKGHRVDRAKAMA